MNDFLTLSLVCTIIGMLAPLKKDSRLKKGISFLSGIVLILAIVIPLTEYASALKNIPEHFLALLFPDNEEVDDVQINSEEWVIRYAKENVESKTAATVENRFGLTPGSVEITVNVTVDKQGNYILSKVRVSVLPNVMLTENILEDYVGNLLACPCEVIFES